MLEEEIKFKIQQLESIFWIKGGFFLKELQLMGVTINNEESIEYDFDDKTNRTIFKIPVNNTLNKVKFK